MELDPKTSAALFERIVTPHLPAAWNLARWLVRDPHDAEDVLQETCVRALRGLDGYRGGEAKSWLLTIVRNLCHDCLRRNRSGRMTLVQDEQIEQMESGSMSPLQQLEKSSDAQQLRRAIDKLPVDYRETLVLREFEGLSYKEISQIAGVPMGTVMSRLARAREKLVETMAPDRAEKRGGQ
jgi:RNA polymerase sigma-70 factor (ECF subfamily)